MPTAITRAKILRARLFSSFFFIFTPSFPQFEFSCILLLFRLPFDAVKRIPKLGRSNSRMDSPRHTVGNLSGLLGNHDGQRVADFADSHSRPVSGSQA